MNHERMHAMELRAIRLREQGECSALQYMNRDDCPYTDSAGRRHWFAGFDKAIQEIADAEEEAKRQAETSPLCVRVRVLNGVVVSSFIESDNPIGMSDGIYELHGVPTLEK